MKYVVVSVAILVLLGGSYFAAVSLRDAPAEAPVDKDGVHRVDVAGGLDVLQFAEPLMDIGEVSVDGVTTIEIPIKNISDETVKVESIGTTCNCLRATNQGNITIPPHEDGVIEMSLQPKENTGRWPLIIKLDNGQQYQYLLVGAAFRELRLSAEELVLASIQVGEEREVVVNVLSDDADCQFGEPTVTHSWISPKLSLEVEPETREDGSRPPKQRWLKIVATLTVTVKPQILGDFKGFVRIPVTTPRGERTVTLAVNGRCTKAVYTIPEQLTLTPQTESSILIIRSGKEFAITGIEPEAFEIVGGVPEGRKRLFRLAVRASKDALSKAASSELACHILVDQDGESVVSVPVVYQDLPEAQ